MASIPSIEEGDEVADDVNDEEEIDDKDGKEADEERSEEGRSASTQYMYFNEIAEAIAPMLDEMFPPSSGVKISA
jgi:hypothetical protein